MSFIITILSDYYGGYHIGSVVKTDVAPQWHDIHDVGQLLVLHRWIDDVTDLVFRIEVLVPQRVYTLQIEPASGADDDGGHRHRLVIADIHLRSNRAVQVLDDE